MLEIIQVQNNLHISVAPASATTLHELCLTQVVHFVEVGTSKREENSAVLDIAVVHNFCEMMRTTVEEHSSKAIIVCPEIVESTSIRDIFYLVGAFLIAEGRSVSDLTSSLWPFTKTRSSVSDFAGTEMKNGWSALSRAKQLAWLKSAKDEEHENHDIYDIEMCLHYANKANGNIHTVVPRKLLFFSSPHDFADSQSWIDITVPGGSVERRFSPAYLADLLVELDASVVACLGECSADVAAAFEEQGLDVHDLKLDPRRPSLLRAMDQLLALARAAPGAVAVFCGDDAAFAWPGHVGTLAAAYLMSDFGFDAGAADAWVRMTCPQLCAPRGAEGDQDQERANWAAEAREDAEEFPGLPELPDAAAAAAAAAALGSKR